MEIVGFWTPEYLAAKRETIGRFPNQNILLAVSENGDWPDDQSTLTANSPDTIRYKSSLRIDDVSERLQRRLR